MDGDSTATLLQWGNSVTPSGTNVISGSGWIYGVLTPTNVGATVFAFSKTESGTGTIKHLYCIDVTALFDAGTISSVAINDLVAMFGGLNIVPGENFAGETTSGTATLTIARGDSQQLVDSPASTAIIKGGDVLSVSAGTVTFVYVTTKITGSGTAEKKSWADKKWCAFGDSLTDPTINATTESIANALLAVAKYRKIKCLDLYHTSGFRVDDATYAQTYTTDYTTTAETYGHPSNVAHERLIAPAFLELLKTMMLHG